MNCHDVRQLRVCAGCAQLGDAREMIRQPRGKGCRHYHGRCFIGSHGMQQLLALPKEQTDKLTLNDIGVAAMRAVMAKGK